MMSRTRPTYPAANVDGRIRRAAWTSKNRTSDSFRRSLGGKPLQYKPVRRIDPRIAWANGVITRATETPAMSGS
ncbi:hypothetical protein [Microlunatus sp. Gsoil 973]|jgi:hypothetical protein|uniref:hypothetical protein n=1 Tax=Microlunatus sp. Gsoil 973 TaxID=2672569 RepID=UPI0012B4FC36|nr:hypothetical protein [Microlunatus sp. Gsoil 973]QGN32601.1 hypothetical protein GJV80_07040 [Microlunatus sp. Gsoil 973]